MKARLYGMAISHPANAARLMLEHKGIEHEIVLISPGWQALRIPLAGFRGGTVPALRLDGRRAVGSRAISRLLDEVRPDPPLFPRDPDRRREVEEAEAWGEEVLQPVPRRLLRWAIHKQPDARVTFARMLGMPLPRVAARAVIPAAAFYARREEAGSTARIRADWAATPGHLDHVDDLLARGVLGGEALNAADFQIATTLRVMLSSEDFGRLVAGRPAEALARRVWPEYPYALPALLPGDLRPAAAA
jgi:glutathione S-transferase